MNSTNEVSNSKTLSNEELRKENFLLLLQLRAALKVLQEKEEILQNLTRQSSKKTIDTWSYFDGVQESHADQINFPDQEDFQQRTLNQFDASNKSFSHQNIDCSFCPNPKCFYHSPSTNSNQSLDRTIHSVRKYSLPPQPSPPSHFTPSSQQPAQPAMPSNSNDLSSLVVTVTTTTVPSHVSAQKVKFANRQAPTAPPRRTSLSFTSLRGSPRATPSSCVHVQQDSINNFSKEEEDSTWVNNESCCSKLLPSFWSEEMVLHWLTSHVKLTSEFIEKIKQLQVDGKFLMSFDETLMEKHFKESKPLHRQKFLIAIRDLHIHGNYCLAKSVHYTNLDHEWLAKQWLKQLGLIQFHDIWLENSIDGRMLASLTEHWTLPENFQSQTLSSIPLIWQEEIEKFCTKNENNEKMEANLLQSFIAGLILLYKFEFDVDRLNNERKKPRNESADVHCDLWLWTNEMVKDWLQSLTLNIDMEKLSTSGLHGAYMVLYKEFSIEYVEQCLSISTELSERVQLRCKLDDLIREARTRLFTDANN